MNIPKPKFFLMARDNFYPIIFVIESFGKHQSIVKIKAKAIDPTFISDKLAVMKLKSVSVHQHYSTSKNHLSIKKSCQQEDIPSKIIKLNKDLIAKFTKFIAENFNSCIDKGKYPSELKHADIVPIHKKKDKSDKSNYRPVTILSDYSKVYEKLIYNQLDQYFENILFLSQCGFRKGYNMQHSLLVLREKFKEAINTGNKFGALLTDFSKAFDSLDHSLLIAKLHWYRLSPSFLNLIYSYFSNRTHLTKIK